MTTKERTHRHSLPEDNREQSLTPGDRRLASRSWACCRRHATTRPGEQQQPHDHDREPARWAICTVILNGRATHVHERTRAWRRRSCPRRRQRADRSAATARRGRRLIQRSGRRGRSVGPDRASTGRAGSRATGRCWHVGRARCRGPTTPPARAVRPRPTAPGEVEADQDPAAVAGRFERERVLDHHALHEAQDVGGIRFRRRHEVITLSHGSGGRGRGQAGAHAHARDPARRSAAPRIRLPAPFSLSPTQNRKGRKGKRPRRGRERSASRGVRSCAAGPGAPRGRRPSAAPAGRESGSGRCCRAGWGR